MIRNRCSQTHTIVIPVVMLPVLLVQCHIMILKRYKLKNTIVGVGRRSSK